MVYVFFWHPFLRKKSRGSKNLVALKKNEFNWIELIFWNGIVYVGDFVHKGPDKDLILHWLALSDKQMSKCSLNHCLEIKGWYPQIVVCLGNFEFSCSLAPKLWKQLCYRPNSRFAHLTTKKNLNKNNSSPELP